MGRRSYEALYTAIQDAFNPEEMSQDNIENWLYPQGKLGKHEIKWGKDRKGEQRYKEVDASPISSGTRRLAKDLSETEKIWSRADEIREIDEIITLRTEAKELKAHRDTTIRKVNEKTKEFVEGKTGRLTSIKSLKKFRSEAERVGLDNLVEDRIRELGVVSLSAFTRELKKSTTEDEIEDILARGEEQLGDKSFESLQEQAGFRLRQLEKDLFMKI